MDVQTCAHKNMDDITWFILVHGETEYDLNHTQQGTGFSMSNGQIMTCAHLFTEIDLKRITIRGRRLDTNEFKTLTLKHIRTSWDLAILEANNVTDWKSGEFVSDGTLYVGQPLLIHGNPSEYVSSSLSGYVTLPCVEEVTLPNGNERCQTFESNAWVKAAPRYPILGQVFHKIMLDARDFEDKEFYRNLNPLIPIITCNGFTCMKGLSGAPAFNSDGKIVGMLVFSNSCSTIFIHVTILRKFFDEYRRDKKGTSQHDEGTSKGKSAAFQSFIQDMQDN